MGGRGAGVRWGVFAGALRDSFQLSAFSKSKNPHEAAGLQIRIQKSASLAHRGAHGLRSQMPAARRAFHGGGPPRGDPVAGQNAIRPRRDGLGLAASIPGGTVNVARTSLTSAAFSSFAPAQQEKTPPARAAPDRSPLPRLSAANSLRRAHDQLEITSLRFAPGCRRLLLYIQ